jgi:hypothetical protein
MFFAYTLRLEVNLGLCGFNRLRLATKSLAWLHNARHLSDLHYKVTMLGQSLVYASKLMCRLRSFVNAVHACTIVYLAIDPVSYKYSIEGLYSQNKS